MILTVTLNAALDVTHRLDRLLPHAGNRVREVAQRAGGKGVNVARVLAALGRETVVTGLAGGPTGAALRTELRAAGLREELLPVAGESRRTVAVVERDGAEPTLLLEPGPVVSPAEWDAFLAAYQRLLGAAAAVVLSGSLPAGLPPDAYRVLIAEARDRGVPAVLDAEGGPLAEGLAAGPALAKPNAHELASVTDAPGFVAGAAALRARGAGAVVVSLGPDGLFADTPDGRWQARPPERVHGNPTGAGDAAVATLTAGLVDGAPWPERLAHAVALSVAAVRAPLAGGFDPATYAALLPRVQVTGSDSPSGEPCPS